MGKAVVDGKPVVTPASEIKVAELKKLADVPADRPIYTEEGGRVLADNEVVRADNQFGVVPDWTRGST